MDVPLVLTLGIEEHALQFFNALRKIYFPDKNEVPDHLTLFRLLPHEDVVIDAVLEVSRQFAPLPLRVAEPHMTGTGVAYRIESNTLHELHDRLRRQWLSFLIPQDQEPLSPHIAVQGVVSAVESTELLTFLRENFCGFTILGTSLQLWEHHGGAWKRVREFPFSAN